VGEGKYNGGGGGNMLDLVFTTKPGLIEDIEITAPVAGSDHNLLNFKVIWKMEEIISKNDSYYYPKRNYVEIRKLLSNICWDEKFNSVDEMWIIFRDYLIGVRDKLLILKCSLTQRLLPPWMTFKIKRGMKKINKA